MFVPDRVVLQEKINIVKDKFAFVDTFKTLFVRVKTYLLDGEPEIPTIYINLSNAEGKYNYGTSGTVLDMTWYARYKPVVDGLIIAFTYLSFIFTVYKRLPDIISGDGAITHNSIEIKRSSRNNGGGDD
jgi:hypothetical protein